MTIGEYMDAEQLAKYAGSIDAGSIDTEYSLPPYGMVAVHGNGSAADERYATKGEVLALRRDLAHLQRIVHRYINHPTDNYGNEVE